MRILPGSLGSFSGLKTDEQARVLDAEQRPIPGLFAVGNDMSSVMQGYYPSGGITLRPCHDLWLSGGEKPVRNAKKLNKHLRIFANGRHHT